MTVTLKTTTKTMPTTSMTTSTTMSAVKMATATTMALTATSTTATSTTIKLSFCFPVRKLQNLFNFQLSDETASNLNPSEIGRKKRANKIFLSAKQNFAPSTEDKRFSANNHSKYYDTHPFLPSHFFSSTHTHTNGVTQLHTQ